MEKRMNLSDQEFISTRAAADRIGVSVRTVQLWVEAGILQAWKTQGGHRRVASASVDALLRRRETQAPTAVQPIDAGPLRVVVVEDDVHLQTMYELTLNSLPFDLTLKLAGDGFTGLVRIGEFRPHVVIADLNLPGLDGFRMIRALKEAPESRDARLLVISALTREDIEDRGGLPADVEVLLKPVPMSVLERAMIEANEKRQRPASYTGRQ
jgi:excisionase family DNA binding protein